MKVIILIYFEKKYGFIYVFFKISNFVFNVICCKFGFFFIGECDFEYFVGIIICCNDWRLNVGGGLF